MNVKIWAEAALFPEKEYINGIAVAVLYLANKERVWINRQRQRDRQSQKNRKLLSDWQRYYISFIDNPTLLFTNFDLTTTWPLLSTDG